MLAISNVLHFITVMDCMDCYGLAWESNHHLYNSEFNLFITWWILVPTEPSSGNTAQYLEIPFT